MANRTAALAFTLALTTLFACKPTAEKTTETSSAVSAAPVASASAATASSVAAKPTSTKCQGGPKAFKAADGENNMVAPAKSHDGLATVWAEPDDPHHVSKDVGDVGKWTLCFERSGVRKALLTSSAGDGGMESMLADFADFVFSRDDRNVFFTTYAWHTTRAAHGVEVATGKEFFIVDGTIVEEIDHGKFKGSLKANHFRKGSPDRSVVDWHGKKLAELPIDDSKGEEKILMGK